MATALQFQPVRPAAKFLDPDFRLPAAIFSDTIVMACPLEILNRDLADEEAAPGDFVLQAAEVQLSLILTDGLLFMACYRRGHCICDTE